MRDVYSHHDHARVGFFKSILEDAGIATFVKNDASFNATEIAALMSAPTLCVVNDEDYARARQLVEQAVTPAPEFRSDWKCAVCGEEVPGISIRAGIAARSAWPRPAAGGRMPEDYLLRLARQLGQLLAALVTMRKEGRKEEAQQEIERVSLDSIGLPWRTVRQSSPEALIEHVRGAGALRHHRAVLLAELLLEEAELADADGRVTDAIRARLQAFCLISDVLDMLSVEDLEVYEAKLEQLVVQLEPMARHPYLAEKLERFRGRGG